MVMIKSLILAGFMLASAFALGTKSTARPSMATLQVQSNFDFSLTSKQFRVHYSGLGSDFSTSDLAYIKIYKKSEEDSQQAKEMHSFKVEENDKKKAYHFALKTAEPGTYEVDICAGQSESTLTCSGKNEALTKIPKPSEQKKLTCHKGRKVNGDWVPATNPEIVLDFKGVSENDWIKPDEFDDIETKFGGTKRSLAASTTNPIFMTEYNKLGLTSNPSYTPNGQIFFAALKYNVSQYKDLFRDKDLPETVDQAHEFCERKYLLSAHAHLVDINTHEVKYRFKTTLFLSEGGKKMFILRPGADKVHVEIMHKDTNIATGEYKLWITFCATEKDAIESTFCSDPIIHQTNFVVSP